MGRPLSAAAAAAAAAGWRSENPADLGTLWLQLLRFYALELADSDAVVSIRQRQPVTRADKGWNNKKISIEGRGDPLAEMCAHFSVSASTMTGDP